MILLLSCLPRVIFTIKRVYFPGLISQKVLWILTARVELPQFDIDRIINFQQGLKKIMELKTQFEKEKKLRLNWQERSFAGPNLSWQNRIKKYFITVISRNHVSTHEFDSALADLTALKLANVKQRPNITGNSENNFSNLDLSNLCFSEKNSLITPFGFGNIDLRGANLSGCTFLGNDFSGSCMHADLTDANLEGARFLNLPRKGICIKTTDFTRANLKNVNLTGICNWNGVNLSQANLQGAHLYDVHGIKLTGSALKEYLHGSNALNVDSAIFDADPVQSVTVHNLAVSTVETGEIKVEPVQSVLCIILQTVRLKQEG